MKIHTKSALIIISTLIIGIVLGVLLSGAFLQHLVTHDPASKLSKHFVHRFHRVIDPDESQRDTVDAILESYSGRFTDMHHVHFSEMGVLMDSMHTELKSVLTEKQLERLRGRMQHWPLMKRGPFGDGRGPFKGGKGPLGDGKGPRQ